MTIKITGQMKKSLAFAAVGSGQCGSRLAASFFKLGYPALAFNTAYVDLQHIELPESNKYHLNWGLGGTSKDRELGREAAQEHRELIYEAIIDKLSDANVLFFCSSLGGGNGGGSIDIILPIMATTGKPIVCLVALPASADDSLTKKNSIDALAELTKLVQSGVISNLIIIDNSKLELIYADISQLDFYKIANDRVIEPLDAFNRYSSYPSNVKSLDQAEFAKILINGSGIGVFGSFLVDDYEEATSIGDAVLSNLEDNLLASEIDLTQTKYAGILLIANQKVSEKVTQNSLTYLVDSLQSRCGTPESIFRGIYVDNTLTEDVVKVYSFFSGLGLPESRIDSLKKEVAEQDAILKEKDLKRNAKLTLDIGVDHSVSAADKARQSLSKKKSAFGNLMNSAKKK